MTYKFITKLIKKEYCFKSAVGFFSFFSSTNVETKNVCPIAYNGLYMTRSITDL